MSTKAAEKIEPAPIKHSFTIEVEIDDWWPDYIANCNDIFTQDRIGYWAYGAGHDAERGWLVYEQGDDARPGDRMCKRVVEMWKRGEKLPPRWFQIDKAVALRAWEEGVKHFGMDWLDEGDGHTQDAVLQYALLGELRYS